MSSPIFSIIAPAIRPENYKRFYNYLNQNPMVPFEIIFVGHKPPSEFIGEHFNYIYSRVKPAQCIELAAREARGEYLIPSCDDCYFSENFLDKLWEQIKIIDTNKNFIAIYDAPSFQEGETILRQPLNKNANWHGRETGICGCFPKKIWREIGGIDQRFIHTLFDVDLAFRCYEKGLSLYRVQDIHIREVYPKNLTKYYNTTRLFRRYDGYNEELMMSLWMKPDGTLSDKRLLPFEPFEDTNIKTVTQGEQGEWWGAS